MVLVALVALAVLVVPVVLAVLVVPVVLVVPEALRAWAAHPRSPLP